MTRLISCCTMAVGICLGLATVGGAKEFDSTAPNVIASSSGKLTVNGKSSFLIAYHLPTSCPSKELVETALSMGAEAFHTLTTGCGSQEAPNGTISYIDGLLNGRALWWSEQTTNVETLPELVSWQATVRSVGTGLLGPGNREFLNSGCDSTQGLWANTRAASGTATQHWIIVSRQVRGEANAIVDSCMTPRALQAEVMTFVAAGGDTIMYNGQGVKLNSNDQLDDNFDVRSDVQTAAHNLSVTLRMMEPIITQGDLVTVKFGSGSTVKATGWRYKGSLYVLAVNTKDSAANGQLGLSQSSGKAVVIGENRSVRVIKKTISERFRGFGWHLYRVG